MECQAILLEALDEMGVPCLCCNALDAWNRKGAGVQLLGSGEVGGLRFQLSTKWMQHAESVPFSACMRAFSCTHMCALLRVHSAV